MAHVRGAIRCGGAFIKEYLSCAHLDRPAAAWYNIGIKDLPWISDQGKAVERL